MAQVREPYTAVGYLAARVPLVKILRLVHPDAPKQGQTSTGMYVIDIASNIYWLEGFDHTGQEAATEGGDSEHEELWTAWDICDGRSHSLDRSSLLTSTGVPIVT